VPRLENRWPVLILQESREMRHPLGTARMAAMSLVGCELHTLSVSREQRAEATRIVADLLLRQPVLIYPGDDALPITDLQTEVVPRPLLFIDASWRKSRRLLHEFPALGGLQRYQLPDVGPSRYRIRREPVPSAVSTLEAIAAALSILEGDDRKYAPMLQAMDWMVDRQIGHMGREVYQSNYAGKRGYLSPEGD